MTFIKNKYLISGVILILFAGILFVTDIFTPYIRPITYLFLMGSSKGKDILLKRQEQLDEQIQLEAIDLATDSILEADRKRREKEELRRMEVQEKALNLLEQYKGQMEPELYEESTKEVKRRIVRKKKLQEQVADQDLASARVTNGEILETNEGEKQKKTRGRKPKKVNEEDENIA